ncbi:hypothetical protein ADK96_11325, partial [Streptomyces sp. IGB124]
MALLALREAGGWGGLDARKACEESLTRAPRGFSRGRAEAGPEGMSFFGEGELGSVEARWWLPPGELARAGRQAWRAEDLQAPRFARNVAVYTAELAGDLARADAPDEAAWAG